MDSFKDLLGNTESAQEIAELWHEYEDAKTPEALFVKDLDKFEMIVQALEYEKCKFLLFDVNACLTRVF
jgi:putative hydrolase of HD superfamily